MTPLFNKSRGSLLIVVLYHFQLNNPIWPDAGSPGFALFIIAAPIIVWLNRRTMFKKGSGVTKILMPEQEETV